MQRKLGIVMDPIEDITAHKDTTLALMAEAMTRGWQLWVMTPDDLFLEDGVVFANTKQISVALNNTPWYEIHREECISLSSLQAIMMRKDPPFDIQYVFVTHLLDIAMQAGTVVVNRPAALRDYNEKLATAHFPDCCVPTLVTRSLKQVETFIEQHESAILKPLDAMGGESIYHVKQGDENLPVIFETLSEQSSQYIMAQQYIDAITTQGDKRIFIIDGKPYPFGLRRIPANGDWRGNLAQGAMGEGFELNQRDIDIANRLGPTLREKGLLFVGIDVIGDYLTEINVTSPTCVREVEAAFDVNICAQIIDALERQLN